MRLILCDDNLILCEALAAGLEACGHQVAGIATSVPEVLQVVAALDPDVCLLDLRFQGSPAGLDALRVISREYPRTKVLVLSGVTDTATVTLALEAGAVGFLRKDQRVSQVADALRVVAGGGLVIYAAPKRARRAPGAHANQPLGELSPREAEVLHRIVAGQDTAQMVHEMGITTNTVQSYVKSVLAKLGAHTRLEAAALASKRGLLVTLGAPRPSSRLDQDPAPLAQDDPPA
jgi:two-component system, NarL family, nitrate/nitrite response regulator NarL